MREFMIEYDLLAMYGRKVPITRRISVQADNISEAINLFDQSIAPGQDCVRVQIFEISHGRINTDT